MTISKPQIGIASTWSMVTPCNMHINELADHAEAGANAAGAKAVVFNTITVSDGISMGTPGMRYSLVSREVICDSIETVVAGQGFDGVVTIGGCDKNMPACVMAMLRLNRPSVFVYGGTIKPGEERRDIVSVFEAVGQRAAGTIDDSQVIAVEKTAIPGPGSCGGCTQQTRWQAQLKRSVCHCQTHPLKKRSHGTKKTTVNEQARLLCK